MDPFQFQASHRRGQEGDSAAAGFQERQTEPRLYDLQRNARDARASSKIQKLPAERAYPAKEEEGIQKELLGDFWRRAVPREVMRAIPLKEKGEIPGESPELSRRWGSLEDLDKALRKGLGEIPAPAGHTDYLRRELPWLKPESHGLWFQVNSTVSNVLI